MSSWRTGGEKWKAWSSRLVTAALQTGCSSQLHVLSCYAPTFAAKKEEKERFYDDLQQALNEIPSSEPYIILGYFNARVGTRSATGNEWKCERGPHGFGEVNIAGRELLTFLSLNDIETTICNTWFMKDINKQTWKHPKSGRWHCIDYAIMRQKDMRDASVMRGAECHAKHQLLRIKVRMNQSKLHHKPQQAGRARRFDVNKLSGGAENLKRERYLEQVSAEMRSHRPHSETGTVEEKWNIMQTTTLVDAAEGCLGFEKRKQPDWLRESSSTLEPLLQVQNSQNPIGSHQGKIEIERGL